MTGVLIGNYTWWDKYAVSQPDVSPLVLEAFAGLRVTVLLAPAAIYELGQVNSIWPPHCAAVVGVDGLAPMSYILVLSAMVFTPLSYIAPAREISIFFAALRGTRFLGEGHVVRRIFAACLMVGSMIFLAIG